MQVIPYESLTAIPWVNGGGITREIAAERDASGILWRISLADVSREGPFSNFAGLQRILTVFHGDGLLLETDDGPLTAVPMMPLPFAGDLAAFGRLQFGPIRDLNVIYRPSRIVASVHPVSGPAILTPASQSQFVFLVSGEAVCAGRALAPLTTVIDPEAPIELAAGAKALQIILAKTGG
ncbi:HutD family protein [Pararhodobacter oceanensis]|uniref:HutD-family protein n=1 Tax=Pararhodobacter oceanensis TaxID=2172121 RepID=A0A2T8HXU2_9RHOB|nr:HutD family protein [Pararhodobacter oceanensis]PVH30250.1 hypothetical protein DDE20_01420 [Pararhodobacter oceanensis]